MPPIVTIVLPLPFAEGFSYLVPEGMRLAEGDWVRVPFGRRQMYGVVWKDTPQQVEESKMKAVAEKIAHLPPLSPAMCEFISWVARYTMAPQGMVLKMVLAAEDALVPPSPLQLYRLSGELPPRMTAARQRVIDILSTQGEMPLPELAEAANVSASVIKSLVAAGALRVSAAPGYAVRDAVSLVAPPPARYAHRLPRKGGVEPPHLSPEQQQAAEALIETLRHGHSVTVLDGLTGSGKTEVYFAAMEKALEAGGQVLVLVPEIALTVQWLARFEARFGFMPQVWHSDIGKAARRETWKAAALGSARVVVGARSALFLPYKNLSLMVVDEEHELSFKQMEGVMYHARDMAVVRARAEKIPLVLVSATPSLETLYNVTSGKYTRVHLPRRFFNQPLPQVELVDMRLARLDRNNFLSPPLRQAMLQALENGHQSLLFLNRRGYAPLVLCRACGHRYQCPHCSAWLVMHRHRPRLQCHHCGHTAPLPVLCGACGEEDSLIPYGPGVERLSEEVAALFPTARRALITSDSVADYKAARELIAQMESGEIDILIGTQMVAKGHHFPNLALVGIVDADMGLSGGDLRAGERSFQLLHQVAGRAGREAVAGKVILQSYLPDHPVMRALSTHDRDGFLALESEYREAAQLPPYGRLAAIILEGGTEAEVAGFARKLAAAQPQVTGIEVLGPAPAPLTLLRGRYRYRLLIKGNKNSNIQQYIHTWLARLPCPASLKLKIDIDPYGFL